VKLLLVDFDGVLNSAAYFTSPEFLALTEGLPDAEVMLLGRAYHLEEAKVGLLNRIVEASGAVVVISSSWRLPHTLDELNEILAERGATFTASAVTPRVTSYEPSLTLRAREILAGRRDHTTRALKLGDNPGL
jgi:16S rRNA C1402 (ribose-2'-O) methylase RsmI